MSTDRHGLRVTAFAGVSIRTDGPVSCLYKSDISLDEVDEKLFVKRFVSIGCIHLLYRFKSITHNDCHTSRIHSMQTSIDTGG